MAVLVGIDEAGYGPLLGPLVISSVTFSIPDDHLKSDMWKLLCQAVGKKKKQLSGRLLITDSKKAYSRSSGIAHLRRTVLATISCLESPFLPSNAAELLNILCPKCAKRLGDYPWYENLVNCGLGGDADDIEVASLVLKKTLSAGRMRLLGMSSLCLDVGYYNKMVSAVNNKASVLFTAVSTLIKEVFDSTYSLHNSDTIQIIVDRQGGRTHYRTLLSRMFPQLHLHILKEDASGSSYELQGNGKIMRLHFSAKADGRFLPVSLASMTSKYVREVMIESMNRYFLDHSPNLKPTAGYWKDGLRFIKDLETSPAHLQYDNSKLVRCR